jgi:glyoxylase-like metal-dependent hydrolase (beta-lactamase superfamily II)
MSFLSPLYPRGPVDLGRNVVALPPNGYVPHLPNWQWIHTPGHTKGHISLFRPEDRTLLPGDAFCTTKPESFLAVTAQKAELHGPPAYYTSDWVRAERSVALLAELEPRAVGPGHGKPIAGEHVASELKLLASEFRRIAVPDDQKQS